jgi:hypothetical protein
MTLQFPNPSRSFDEINKCVSFWGYDSVIEVSFSIEGAALVKLHPGTVETEAGFLKAFDAVQKKIHKTAEAIYSRGRRNGTFAYNLAADDFQ